MQLDVQAYVAQVKSVLYWNGRDDNLDLREIGLVNRGILAELEPIEAAHWIIQERAHKH